MANQLLYSPSNAANQSYNGTQFMDLNVDVQLLILENLNVRDLLSIAKTNDHLAALAGTAFKKQHAGKIVTFFNPFIKYVGDDLHETDEYIYVQHVHSFLAVLKHFGRSILKLSVNHSIGIDLTEAQLILVKKINGLISSYCADTLLQFEMSNSQETGFDGLTKPFTKVQIIKLRGEFKRTGNSIFTFDELFPAVKRLSLPDVQYINLSFVGWNLSQLEHIELQIHPFQPLRFTEGDIEQIFLNNPEAAEILRRNPQIKSLKLSCSSRKFLEMMNNILPDLEILDLEYYKPPSIGTTNKINFQKVKTFTIYTIFGDSNSIPENISFEELTELHTNANDENGNWWIDFMKDNKDLKQLHLDSGCVDSEILEEIISMESNLNEVSLTVCRYVDYKRISEFVRRTEHVRIIRFLHFHSDVSLDPLSCTLRKKLSNEWKIIQFDREIRLERKLINDYNSINYW